MKKEDSIWKKLERHKGSIYYFTVIIFVFIGIIYAWKGYDYYQTIGTVENGNELLGRIFTPFVLAVIRFVIVTLLGIFVAMNIIAIPLKRIKVMQFEVEFTPETATEIAKTQEKQINQLHFIEKILQDNQLFVGRFLESNKIPYQEVTQLLFNEYEEFFNKQLEMDLQFELINLKENETFPEQKYQRLANKLLDQNKKIDTITRNRYMDKTNVLLTHRKVMDNELILLLTSSEQPFTEYDAKIVNSIFETVRIICDNIIVLSNDSG